MSRSLPTITSAQQGLGRATIMDRALAESHGVAYVHLAVFAIDVDRVRDHLEDQDDDDDLPMGWEVFLVERFLESQPDLQSEATCALLEDVVLAIFELPASDDPVFGSQLPFAVWHAVARGVLPRALEAAFRSWKARPKALAAELDTLYANRDETTRRLARRCLDATLTPPLAPPAREALEALSHGLTRS